MARLKVTIVGYLNDYAPRPGQSAGYAEARTLEECIALDLSNDPHDLIEIMDGLENVHGEVVPDA